MVHLQFLLSFYTVLNLIFYLNAQYNPTPSTTDVISAALKQALELKCEYVGNDIDGEFVAWFKDNVTVSSEQSDHYEVKQNEKESILKIKIFVQDDGNVKNWYVTTNKKTHKENIACKFGSISVKPSPQRIETNRQNEKLDISHSSIRRSQDNALNLTCIVEPKVDIDQNNQINWTYSEDGVSFAGLPSGIITEDDKLTIDKIKKHHNGYYRCSLNDVSFTVLLRVKNRLAALWPFIGIVSVVIVLVIVILIFEKRQRSLKKSASNDNDDQDQAKDPLVSTTNKTADSDTQQRTVNT